MAVLLKNIYSIINDKHDAKDFERAFTFIEFIKEFGYDNSTVSFINDYKTYLSLWTNKKESEKDKSDVEFIRENLIDTLKSIVLTYSSYEEQDFIANIDWDNEMHRKAIVPFFAEKIKSICDFYKSKRQEAHLIINKNKFKGSKLSLEQIIYDKIIDFYFENKNLKPQIAELQNNLSISIEQFVDVYSDYFDIPRDRKPSEKSRQEFITANMNTPSYEDYVQVSQVISDLLFSGEVYLEEIPLVAQVGLDLSQRCAGDAATLRDVLLNNATINLISLNDQIALKRKLYEKYLGCDLYYIYCDTKDTVYLDLLTKAENPSGNLLNCGTADTAVTESEKLKLLSHIGLFFKPDKTGILKVNADNYKWEVDKSKLEDETFYVFPDPNKCGDIGNNKSSVYPLVFEYKLDSYIKNLSSGFAKDEPLAYLSSTTWNTYFTAQDRDYIHEKNVTYDYSFTSLANQGVISNYQRDIYGTEFALFKDYYEDKDGNIHVSSKFKLPEVSYIAGGNKEEKEKLTGRFLMLNGGYYQDPYTYPSDIDDLPFNHEERSTIKDDYMWTGMEISCNSFNVPDHLENSLSDATINLGSFTKNYPVKYHDHYKVVAPDLTNSEKIGSTFTNNLILNTFTSKIAELKNTKIIVEDKTYFDINGEAGTLWIKEVGKKPKEITLSYNHLNTEEDNDKLILNEGDKFTNRLINYSIVGNIVILEVKKGENVLISFIKEEIEDELKFYEIESIEVANNAAHKVLYNETENKILIAILEQNATSDVTYNKVNLVIHEFNLDNNKLNREIVNIEKSAPEFSENFRYVIEHAKLSNFVFSYNNELDTYLITYMFSTNGIPYIYEHIFRLYNIERFKHTLKSYVYYEGAEGVENKRMQHLYNDILETTKFNRFFTKQ